MQNQEALGRARPFPLEARTFPTIRGNSPSTGFAGALAGYMTAGLCLLFVVLGVGLIFVAFLVYAGLCALVGGLLLFLAGLGLARHLGYDDPPGWGECFRAAYWGYLIALVVDMLVSLISGGVDALTAGAVVPVGNPQSVADVFALDLLRDFASWLWPGIPVTMLVLAVTHRMYRGTAGMLRGLAVTVVSLPGSLLFPVAILVGWQQRAGEIQGPADIVAILAAMGVLLGIFVVVAAVPGGAALTVAARHAGAPRPGGPWRAWRIAALGLLVWGAVTMAVMLVLPFFDPFSAHLWEIAGSDAPLAYIGARPLLVPLGVLTFALVQTPGVVVASRVVRRRLALEVGGSWKGRSALGVTAAIAVSAWPVALGIAWILSAAGR